jgi:hypothetical protein
MLIATIVFATFALCVNLLCLVQIVRRPDARVLFARLSISNRATIVAGWVAISYFVLGSKTAALVWIASFALNCGTTVIARRHRQRIMEAMSRPL